MLFDNGEDGKKIEIRNSTMEFPIFQFEGKELGVQVVYLDETVWCNLDAIISVGYLNHN